MTAMKSNEGFTLIEIMFAMTLFAVVVAAVYETYDYQNRSYIKQEQVADMQQEARAAQYFTAWDIRMAGYDPTGNAEAGFSTAETGEATFELDLNADGDVDNSTGEPDSGEIVRYALTNDSNGDGISDGISQSDTWRDDGSACSLGREYITRSGGAEQGGGLQPVTDNIQALEFCYVLEDGTETVAPTSSERAAIRAVYISMLFRTENTIKGYTNDKTYTPASADASLTPNYFGTRPVLWGPFEDRYQRRLAILKLRCRNMGLNPYGD